MIWWRGHTIGLTMRKFITELRRRNVFRAAAAYAVMGWITAQVANIFFPALQLPDWTVTLVVVLLLLGFPVALFLAWAYEITPEGIRREGEMEQHIRSPSEASSKSLDVLVIVLLLAALGVFVGERIWSGQWSGRAPVETAMTARPLVVVLPFRNLGRSEDEYFADGITDEISTRLTRLDQLGLIARTSALQYKDTAKSIPEIAEELGVDYILEGTVRWAHLPDGSSRVRVTPQLIRASEASPIWADSLEEPLVNVFELQARIAERVAEAMDIAVLEPDKQILRAEPTRDLEAYDFYLRGLEYFWRSELEEDFRLAQRMFEAALQRDPDFALAHAMLSRVHTRKWWWHFDRSPERLESAKQAVHRALKLDPDLLEGRLAMGWFYYHGLLQYEPALAEFEAVRARVSEVPDVFLGMGSVQRRQGLWKEAAENYERAVRLDPRSATLNSWVGQTYFYLRDYTTAEHYLRRAIALAPELHWSYANLSSNYLAADQNTRRARTVLEQALRAVREDAASAWIQGYLIRLDVFDRDLEGARRRAAAADWGVLQNQYQFEPVDLWRGMIAMWLGSPEEAGAHFESARVLIVKSLEDEFPEDPRVFTALGIAHAGLGEFELAIELGEKGHELMPMEREAMRGAFRVEELARIYAMAGEHDAAIETLEPLLARPSHFSVADLRLDPVWDPLRDHPGFKRLLEVYSGTPAPVHPAS